MKQIMCMCPSIQFDQSCIQMNPIIFVHGFYMNTETSDNHILGQLLTLHKQAKIWATWNFKFVPCAFFVVNDGAFPNCDQMHQLKCNIIHVVPFTLIEMKRKGKKGSLLIYIVNFETSFNKRQKHIRVSQFQHIRIPFQSTFLMQLKIGLKYEYLDDIENNFFSISNFKS